jgi:predicted nuclease of restriction endonuclease-like (RecB) superfamily
VWKSHNAKRRHVSNNKTVKLREKFVQLKKFLAIKQSPEIESKQIEKLSTLVAKLAEELDQQKVIMQAVASENLKIRREFKEFQMS